jgi:hypothetical protein
MICENRPWKSTIQNSLRTAEPENRLTRFFFNSENWGNYQNGKIKVFMITGRFSEPAPKTKINNSHERGRTTNTGQYVSTHQPIIEPKVSTKVILAQWRVDLAYIFYV